VHRDIQVLAAVDAHILHRVRTLRDQVSALPLAQSPRVMKLTFARLHTGRASSRTHRAEAARELAARGAGLARPPPALMLGSQTCLTVRTCFLFLRAS
jgi:hypothetical protein